MVYCAERDFSLVLSVFAPTQLGDPKMEDSIAMNLARDFADDTASVSTALLKARKTAVKQFNEFL